MESIRRAGPGDAAAIAALHAASWQAHYRGILPDHYLDHEGPAERSAYWDQALHDDARPDDLVLVAEQNGRVAGFIAVRRDGEPGIDALIDNLHVHADQQGRGLGRRLIAAALEQLIPAGARSASLWVFDDNAAAIRFYVRLGGVADQHGIDPFAGANAPDTRFTWRNLPELLARCRQP